MGYCVLLWILRNSSYRADPFSIPILEMAGSLIAFTFAANAMVRFRGTHDRISSLILAFGFVLAGLIEAGTSMDVLSRHACRGVARRIRNIAGMVRGPDAAGCSCFFGCALRSKTESRYRAIPAKETAVAPRLL